MHNKQPAKKIEIRRRLIEALGAPARVLETHAGFGCMRKGCYGDVEAWLGIDSDPKTPHTIHADNCDVLRAINLQGYNFFDVAAYGSPWQQVWIISQRRTVAQGERIAFAVTGSQQAPMGARAGSLRAAGWSRQQVDAIKANTALPSKYYVGDTFAVETMQGFVSAWFPGCRIERWIDGRSQSVRYAGWLLRGI